MWRVMARTFRGRLSLLIDSSRSAGTMPPWMWPGGPSCMRSSWICAVAVMWSGLDVSVVKVRWRPWGLAGPQPKQWLARSSMVGASIEAGVWRVASGVGMASGLHVSTMQGGMNSDSVLRLVSLGLFGRGRYEELRAKCGVLRFAQNGKDFKKQPGNELGR